MNLAYPRFCPRTPGSSVNKQFQEVFRFSRALSSHMMEKLWHRSPRTCWRGAARWLFPQVTDAAQTIAVQERCKHAAKQTFYLEQVEVLFLVTTTIAKVCTLPTAVQITVYFVVISSGIGPSKSRRTSVPW